MIQHFMVKLVFLQHRMQCIQEHVRCVKKNMIDLWQKLTERQKVQLAILLSDFEYASGGPVTPPEHALHGW